MALREAHADFKRAVFSAVAMGQDYMHAFMTLDNLPFKEGATREMVKIIMTIASAERTWNQYYGLLICKLCDTKQSHRFSLKIAFYDFFKALQERPDEITPRAMSAHAAMLAFTIQKQCASIAILKALDLAHAKESAAAFAVMFFSRLLSQASPALLRDIFKQIGAKESDKDGPHEVLLAIEIFFQRHMRAMAKEDEDLSEKVIFMLLNVNIISRNNMLIRWMKCLSFVGLLR